MKDAAHGEGGIDMETTSGERVFFFRHLKMTNEPQGPGEIAFPGMAIFLMLGIQVCILLMSRVVWILSQNEKLGPLPVEGAK